MAEILIAVLDLIQAEIRQAKKQFLSLGIALGIVIAASAMLIAGGLLLIFSLYQWLTTMVSTAMSACLCGLVALVLAWLLVSVAQRYAERE